MKTKVLAITGLTASGKTDYALEKAKELDGEIISADSRQVYKHLDIVTGKDFEEPNWQLFKTLKPNFDLGYYTVNSIPVWLYDVLEPSRYFSAFNWLKCAKEVIKIVIKKNKLPILVGGSYFYLQSLLYGLDNAVGADYKLRKELSLLNILELQEKLKELDESVWLNLNRSDRLNKRRLIRHLEKTVNKADKLLLGEPGILVDYNVEILGLKPKNKTQLERQIAKRVQARLKNGAIEETQILLQMGYNRSDPGLITIGYKQLLAYLNEETSLEEATNIWIKKELQYAKRQLTFMKKNLQINWVNL